MTETVDHASASNELLADPSLARQPLGSSRYLVADRLPMIQRAWRLVYAAYRRLGIVDDNPHRFYCPEHALTNDLAVALQLQGHRCVTTMTSFMDHPRHGLPLDRAFPRELDALRAKGHKLFEIGLFADRQQDLCGTRQTILAMTRLVVHFGFSQRADTALIGVHPRHANFYCRWFNCRRHDSVTLYQALNGAPVVLLSMDKRRWGSSDTLRPGTRHLIEHPVSLSEYRGRVVPAQLLKHQRQSAQLHAMQERRQSRTRRAG